MGDTLQRTVNEIDLQLYERYGRLHLFGAIKKLPPSSSVHKLKNLKFRVKKVRSTAVVSVFIFY